MKPHILLIEDGKTHLKTILSLLDEFGFSVSHASTGKEGLDFALDKKPDLILLDMALPGVGGLEVCQRLKETHETSAIPILFLTQKKKIEDRIAAFNAGANDFISKPCHPEELKERILAALRTREKLYFFNREIQLLENHIEQIQTLAAKDPLTHLFSRKPFLLQLKNEFIRSLRYHLPLTLCLIDIDHLNTINRLYGEPAGDSVLIETASILQQNFREIDIISRIENDDFFVSLPHSSIEDSMIPLSRFQKQVNQCMFKTLPPEHKITVSAGMVSLPNANFTGENHLIDAAKKALRQAREKGDNQISIWKENGKDEKND
ncbi:MAG: diguanylate cyclase [Nitrospirae bacterium]|nr:diguanylate cyclase [Nitrospirota bacterium]